MAGAVLLHALSRGSVVLHLSEGETVLRIPVSLGDDIFNSAMPLKEPPQLALELLGIGLHEARVTLPSRLVMKSLVVCCFSSDRERYLRLAPLEELDYDINQLYAIQIIFEFPPKQTPISRIFMALMAVIDRGDVLY